MGDTKDTAHGGELQRGIHPWMANLIALGGIIGSCYFVGSGWLIKEMGVSAVFAFILGGIIISVVMQSFAELLVNIPRRGNFISYTKEFISPVWAVGTGWSYWMNWVAYVPSEAVAGGIIMTKLFGEVPMFGDYTQTAWAFLFLTIITVINLSHVENFGFIESVLAILKISAVVLFCVIALMLVTGVFSSHPGVGTSILLPNGTINKEALFPAGYYPLFGYLAIILVNFQGSEIVGLAAAETKDPEITIPKACKQVTYRIIGVYVIPIIFLVLILSRTDAGLDGSMFAAALDNYTKQLNMPWLHWVAAGFAVVVLTAAFSAANSGMFGSVRAMYALSHEGMAPKFLGKVTKAGAPMNAIYFTLIACWISLLINALYSETNAFAILISISGFTGTICWISISLSQIRFRREVKKRGYSYKELKHAAPWAPFFALVIGVGLESLGLLLMLGDPRKLFTHGWESYMASGDPILQQACVWSVIAVAIPMIIFAIGHSRGHIKVNTKLHPEEKHIDDLFPHKTPHTVQHKSHKRHRIHDSH